MNTRQTSLAIQGMRQVCANRAVAIERALTRLDGVIASNVNYATEHATVMFNPARVSAAQMVQAVRREGFDVRQQRVGLDVDGLMYASSARTVARVLERVDGVVHASVDLQAQRIELEVLAERENRPEYARAIANLGFRVVEQPTPHPSREFAARSFCILALALLGLWSAGAHAGLIGAGFIHAPRVVMAAAVIMTYGIGRRFYHLAFDACIQGEFDGSAAIALVASTSLLFGLPSALIAPTSVFATSGLILAMVLTAGWFIARGAGMWVSPRIKHATPTTFFNPKTMAPILAGSVASFALFALYIFILTVFQDFAHAIQQAGQDWLWIGLVSLGFGTQIGLYTHLRLLVSAAKAVRASAATGAGTATSTLGMVACCAHHLTDLAPLIALTGATGLSGAISFLNEWKYALIALGLIVNAVGIVITLRTIRQSRANLKPLLKWFATEPAAQSVCH